LTAVQLPIFLNLTKDKPYLFL